MYSVRVLLALVLAGLMPRFGFCAESLVALYREARINNATFLAARAGVQAEQENEYIARGQLFPSVGISGSYGRNNTERKTGNSPSEKFDYDSNSYSINLRQPIYRKYNFALYQQGIAQGEAASAHLNQAENELVVRLASAYMEALFADDQVRLLDAQKAAVAGQLDAAEKGLLAGSGTRIDIDEARARYDMILAQEIEIQNLRQHNRRVLGAFVNRNISVLPRLDLKAFTPRQPVPADVNTWLAEAEAKNAEYQYLLAQAKVAEQEVEKALAGHYPTLDFVAGKVKSGNDSVATLNRFGDTEYDTTSYGVQLSIPLFAGFQVNATIRQARAKLEQVRQQGEEVRRNIEVQVRREFDNVVQGIARINALVRAEASANQSVLSAKKGVQAGVRSTLDVLQVEQQLFTVIRDLAQARYGYLISGLKLKAIAGVLTDSDVERVSLQMSDLPLAK